MQITKILICSLILSLALCIDSSDDFGVFNDRPIKGSQTNTSTDTSSHTVSQLSSTPIDQQIVPPSDPVQIGFLPIDDVNEKSVKLAPPKKD